MAWRILVAREERGRDIPNNRGITVRCSKTQMNEPTKRARAERERERMVRASKNEKSLREEGGGGAGGGGGSRCAARIISTSNARKL